MHSFARWVQVVTDFSIFIYIFFLLLILFCLVIWRLYKSSLSSMLKQIIFSFCFSLFLFYGVFMCGEAYFRYVYDQSDALGFLLTNKHWLEKHVVYNNLRLRDDKDYSEVKKPGVFRIGVVGDSLAFGYGIKNVDDRFSNILEKKLKASGKKVEVYNLGQPGLDTCGEVEHFKKYVHLHFDLIIWEYFLNDIQPCKNSTGTKILINAKIENPFVKWLADRSYVINYFYWRLFTARSSMFYALRYADLMQYYNPQVLKLEQESMDDLYTEFRGGENKDIPVVVIIFPYLYLIGPNYPAKDVHPIIHKMLSDIGVKQSIDLLPDLIKKQPKDVIVNQFDSHPNEAVNKLAAEKLYKAVSPLIK